MKFAALILLTFCAFVFLTSCKNQTESKNVKTTKTETKNTIEERILGLWKISSFEITGTYVVDPGVIGQYEFNFKSNGFGNLTMQKPYPSDGTFEWKFEWSLVENKLNIQYDNGILVSYSWQYDGNSLHLETMNGFFTFNDENTIRGHNSIFLSLIESYK